MSKYIPVIGMEIHVELKTESKMFCNSKNGMGLEKEPNVNVCPLCTGQPGTLPVPNEKAIRYVQMAGLALNCELNLKSKFDRKNYFYPDLPKGYQISQFDQPLCGPGCLEIDGKSIGITRIHLEEDTGKLIHPDGANYTLVDYNRAGVPLMELVTDPDLENGQQARAFCQKLQQICRYLEISDADMEKGHMRCEVNLSLYKEGEDRLSGTKVEVKNINSFRFVEKAINYEIERQTELLDKGESVVQETRGWDSVKNITVSQRKKESAHDYRYFPEPDIPPLEFSEKEIEHLKSNLPELPDAKEKRFVEQFGLSQDTVSVLVSEKNVADYFEQVVSELHEKIEAGEFKLEKEKANKLSANYILTELRKYMMESGDLIKDIKITPENYAELIGYLGEAKINSSAAQVVLKEMYATGADPSHIIEEKNLMQVSNTSELEGVVEQVLNENPQSVTDYKNGKENAIKFLMGQVMKLSKGKANPQMVMEILKSKLTQ